MLKRLAETEYVNTHTDSSRSHQQIIRNDFSVTQIMPRGNDIAKQSSVTLTKYSGLISLQKCKCHDP